MRSSALPPGRSAGRAGPRVPATAPRSWSRLDGAAEAGGADAPEAEPLVGPRDVVVGRREEDERGAALARMLDEPAGDGGADAAPARGRQRPDAHHLAHVADGLVRPGAERAVRLALRDHHRRQAAAQPLAHEAEVREPGGRDVA